MTIRDLPGILRLIARANAASVVVVHGDDVVTFNISDLDVESALAFKSILHRVYLHRGHASVIVRKAKRGKPWKPLYSRCATVLGNFSASVLASAAFLRGWQSAAWRCSRSITSWRPLKSWLGKT